MPLKNFYGQVVMHDISLTIAEETLTSNFSRTESILKELQQVQNNSLNCGENRCQSKTRSIFGCRLFSVRKVLLIAIIVFSVVVGLIE